MTSGYALLQRFLRTTSGFALDDDKRYLFEAQLAPLLRAQKISSLDELGCTLHLNPRGELARSVVEALTINETSFFRDRTLFTSLTQRILPDTITALKDRRSLRIWSAGCSTGQEPYSLAMLIDEQMRHLSGWTIEIFATDITRSVIATAQRGHYSQFEVQRGLPIQMLLRYFHRVGEEWSVSDYLRAKVTFKVHNLMADFGDLGLFDVILCRNVLFYLDATSKRQILAKLAGALSDAGILVLGGAERIGGLNDTLRPDPRGAFVFTKREAAQRLVASALPA